MPKQIDSKHFDAQTQTIGITIEQSSMIEESTRTQSQSHIWHFET